MTSAASAISPPPPQPPLRARAAALVTFPALLIAVLMAAPFFSSSDLWTGAPLLRDSDIWWHLRNAQTLLTSHHFITQDLYSFTTYGQPWINPEWLAEIPYYLGFQALGPRGLFLVMLAAFEVIIAAVLGLAYLKSRNLMAAFVTSWLAVFLAIVNFGPRTILFGWICFMAELLLLEAYRSGKDLLWLLPPVFCLWINLHGSWMIGLVFFAMYAASGLVQGSWGSVEALRWTGVQRRRLAVVGAATVAALFVNPYGWRLVAYPFDMAFQQKLNIAVGEEWQSVNFHKTNGKIAFLCLVAVILLNLLRRRRWLLPDLLFVLLAVYSGLTYVRFLFLAGLVLCPMLSIDLAHWIPKSQNTKNRPVLNAVFIAAVWIFALSHLWGKTRFGLDDGQDSPAAAVRALEARPAGRVFNAYAYGGYLIWNARQVPTFLDSRTDIFEHHGILADYMKAISLTDTYGVLEKYRIRYVLFPQGDPVVYLLEHNPGWKVDYADPATVLLERAAEAH